MSKVDRGAKKQERIRRALQRLSEDPSGTLGVAESGSSAMFFSGSSSAGGTAAVAAATDLKSASLFAGSREHFNDSCLRSRGWMGI